MKEILYMAENIQKEYEEDFYAWTEIEFIRGVLRGKLPEAEIDNIMKEVENLGKKERKELIDKVAIIINDVLPYVLKLQEERKREKYN